MPEINPLTNNQIFLKKIAENTGSDYETGDVSEINPLTIDQIFLKEIAANTAGQSGDITELEGKVADNTSAIEAIVNVNGCCNVCPPTNYNNLENYGVYYTTNADKSITAQGATGADASGVPIIAGYVQNKYVGYKLSGSVGGSNSTYFINVSYSNDGTTWLKEVHQYDAPIVIEDYPYIQIWLAIRAGVTVNTTFYPMLYDARLTPTDYVPYAMTNRELTERVKVLTIPISSVTIAANGINLLYNNPCPTGYIPISAMFDRGAISNDSVLLSVYLDSGTDVRVIMYNCSNASIELNGSVKVLCIKA